MNSAAIGDILNQAISPQEEEMLAHFSSVESLVSRDEALALYRLCKLLPEKTSLLEIGPFRGGSTVAIGHAARARDLQVHCLDRWADYRQQPDFLNMDKSTLDDQDILKQFMNNTSFIENRLFMLRGNSKGFGKILGNNSFSLVFIDGAHDYFSVLNDLVLGLKVIEPGGILCGHDYHSAGTDVKRAVHDVIIKSETITTKGLIAKTTIWFCTVEDPEYEYLIATTIQHMAKGDFGAAYENLTGGMGRVRQTAELERIRVGLESQLRTGPCSAMQDCNVTSTLAGK